MRIECKNCNGRGWYADHAPLPHPDGDCCGNCPIQVQCEDCNGTGYIDIDNDDDIKPAITTDSERDPFQSFRDHLMQINKEIDPDIAKIASEHMDEILWKDEEDKQ